jgi:hypothetical protein
MPDAQIERIHGHPRTELINIVRLLISTSRIPASVFRSRDIELASFLRGEGYEEVTGDGAVARHRVITWIGPVITSVLAED